MSRSQRIEPGRASVRAARANLLRRAVIEALEKRVLFSSIPSPTDLHGTAFGGQIALAWTETAPEGTVADFLVQRADGYTDGYHTATNWITIAQTPYTDTSFTDTADFAGLPANTGQAYQVIAEGYGSDDNQSNPSAELDISTLPASANPKISGNVSLDAGQVFDFEAHTNELADPQLSLNWGDGSSGDISAAGATAYVDWSVPDGYGSASHAFAEGNYTAQLTFADAGNATASANFTVTVGPAPLAVSVNPLSASAGTSLTNVTLGTVSTDDCFLTTGNLSGTINWGSGEGNSSASFAATDVPGVFSILGSHTYSTTGNEAISITVSGGNTTISGNGTNYSTVTPSAPTVVGTPLGGVIGLTWPAVSGASAYQLYRGTGTSGSLVYLDTVTGATTYSDDNMGDGLETGTTYRYAIKSVSSAGTSLISPTTSATTANLALTNFWISSDAVNEGDVVEVIINSNDINTPNASIDFGDGTGAHSMDEWAAGDTEYHTIHYTCPSTPGVYEGEITISSIESHQTQTYSFTLDVNSNLNVTVPDYTLARGQSLSGTIASFTDDAGIPAGNYTATIFWGDGGNSTGTVTADGDGAFAVSGNHTFTTDTTGGALLDVTIAGADGTTVTAGGSLTVAPLLISGPNLGSQGHAAAYSAIAMSGSTLSWQVSKGLSIVATGSGDSFTFTPSLLGTYSVAIAATGTGGNYTSGITLMVPISGTGAIFSDGTLLGTKQTQLADGYTVGASSPFIPAVLGNYSFEVTIPLSSTSSLTDGNSVSYTGNSSISQDLIVNSTESAGGAWTYSETVTQITATLTTPVTSGTGGTQSETLTDTYNFSATGGTVSSGYTFTSGESDVISGLSASPSTDTWTLTGNKATTFTSSGNISSGSNALSDTQSGGDSYFSSGTIPYTNSGNGTTLTGNVAQTSSWNDSYSYSPTAGSYAGAHSNSWNDSGTGNYTTTTVTSGNLTLSTSSGQAGNYTNNSSSSGNITQSNSGTAAGTYVINSTFTGGAWVKSGTDTTSDITAGHWHSSGTGNYTDTTVTTASTGSGQAGDTTLNGSFSSLYDTTWGNHGNLTQTYGSDGNWTTSGGTNNSTGTTTNSWSDGGTGTGHDTTTATGSITGSTGSPQAGSYNNTSSQGGLITNSDTHSSVDSYNINGNWSGGSGGSWVQTGTDTGTATDGGNYTYSPTGNFTDITNTSLTTAATSSTPYSSSVGNSTVTGNTNSTYATNWGDSGNSSQSLGSDGNWTLTAGDNSSTGTTTNNWSYGGIGAGHDTTTVTGTLSNPGTTGNYTGNFTNTSVDGGNLTDNGNHTSLDHYDLHSVWATGNWTITGNDTGTATDHGDYSYTPAGNFTDVTHSSLTIASTTDSPTSSFTSSDSNVTGNTGTNYITNWGDSGNSTQAYSGTANSTTQTGSWTLTAGTGTSTGTTTNNWNYGGNGTQSDSTTFTGNLTAPAGTVGNFSGNFTNSSGDSGSITDNGNHTSTDIYTLSSVWSAGNWTTTGNDTGNQTDQATYSFTPTGNFTDITHSSLTVDNATTPYTETSSDSNVTGNIGTTYITNYGDNGNSTQFFNGTVWTTTSGSGNSTGTVTNNSSYSGIGSRDDSNYVDGNITDASGTLIGNFTNSSDNYGSVHDGGNSTSVDQYTLNSLWHTASGTVTAGWATTGNDTGNATDHGSYTFAPAGNFTDTTTTATGNAANYATSDRELDGAIYGNYGVNWGDSGNSTQSYNGTSWALTSGSGSATGTTTNNWSYSGDGTGIDTAGSSGNITGVSGTVIGNYTNSSADDGDLYADGDSTSVDQYTLNSVWHAASGSATAHWATTGTDTGNATDDGFYSYTPTGNFTDISHTSTGDTANYSISNSTLTGGISPTYIADWGDSGNSAQTFNGTSWSLTSGNGTSSGTITNDGSYSGNGTGGDSARSSGNVTSDGTPTGAVIGNYSNSTSDTPTVTATGNSTSVDQYAFNSVWSAGNWTTTGNDTGTATDHGVWTDKPGGNFTDVTHTSIGVAATDSSPTTSLSTGNSTLTGGTTGTYSTNWGDHGNSAQSFSGGGATPFAGGNWSMISGDGTATGSTTNNWSYGGNGTGDDHNNSTGNLTGVTTGNFTNDVSESGPIHANGNHTELGSYTVQSVWSAGNWTIPTGTYSGNATDTAHYDWSPSGEYSDQTTIASPSDQAGNSSMGGGVYGDFTADWGDKGESAKTLGSDGGWTTTTGDSTATGSTHTDWSYDGGGTSHNPSRTYNIDVGGDNITDNSYSLNSDWEETAWQVVSGDQNTTVTNSGHWNTTTSYGFTPSTGNLSGSQTLVHNNTWNVTGNQAQHWNGVDNGWETDSKNMNGNSTTLDGTYTNLSGNWTTPDGTFAGQGYIISHTASDHSVNLTSVSATFSSTLGGDGSTTYDGTGFALVSSGDAYAYSGNGSVVASSENNSDYSGDGTTLDSIAHTDSGDINTTSTTRTNWSLNAGATWIASGTDLSITGHGNATYSDTTLYSGNQSTSTWLDTSLGTESMGYSYSQHPHNTIDGNGTSAISGNGTFNATATGDRSTASVSHAEYGTPSDYTSNSDDAYTDDAHWSESYTDSGTTRSDPVDDRDDADPGEAAVTSWSSNLSAGNSTSVTYGVHLLTGAPWDNTAGVGVAGRQPSLIYGSSLDPSGSTMPNVTDPNSVPAKVNAASSNAALSAANAQATSGAAESESASSGPSTGSSSVGGDTAPVILIGGAAAPGPRPRPLQPYQIPAKVYTPYVDITSSNGVTTFTAGVQRVDTKYLRGGGHTGGPPQFGQTVVRIPGKTVTLPTGKLTPTAIAGLSASLLKITKGVADNLNQKIMKAEAERVANGDLHAAVGGAVMIAALLGGWAAAAYFAPETVAAGVGAAAAAGPELAGDAVQELDEAAGAIEAEAQSALNAAEDGINGPQPVGTYPPSATPRPAPPLSYQGPKPVGSYPQLTPNPDGTTTIQFPPTPEPPGYNGPNPIGGIRPSGD